MKRTIEKIDEDILERRRALRSGAGQAVSDQQMNKWEFEIAELEQEKAIVERKKKPSEFKKALYTAVAVAIGTFLASYLIAWLELI